MLSNSIGASAIRRRANCSYLVELGALVRLRSGAQNRHPLGSIGEVGDGSVERHEPAIVAYGSVRRWASVTCQ